jgi:hypothetical protein
MSDPTPRTDLYTTVDELKVIMGVDPDLSADDELMNAKLASWIEVVSRWIDAYCRRTFYATTATRTYRLPPLLEKRATHLWLGDDLLALTSLTIDGATVPSSDYSLCPERLPVKGWIELHQRLAGSQQWEASKSEVVVAIEGSWGFVTAESAILVRQACQLWVMEINQRSLYPGAQNVRIGDYSYTFRGDSEQRVATPDGQTLFLPPGQIALLLNGLRRREIGTFA